VPASTSAAATRAETLRTVGGQRSGYYVITRESLTRTLISSVRKPTAMSEAQTLAIIAGGVGGAVGAFVGVAVGGSALAATLTTLVVALLVGGGVVASAVIAGDVEFFANADGE